MKKLLMIASLVAASAAALAQNATGGKKVHLFGHTEDIDTVMLYRVLHRNAPKHFQIEGVPAVAVVGKDSKFLFGVGGFIKAVVGADFGHPIPSADEFITSQIPMGPTDGDGARFNLSAKQTHLFVNFVALPGSDNEIGAFISANFLNDYLPTLQAAYLKYRGFKAGYDNTLFSDPQCGAPAVDYEGPCSNTANPVPGISYMFEHRRGNWKAGLGMELPTVSFTTIEGRNKYVYQRAPDIPIAGQYDWHNGQSWVRLAAVMRTLTYRELGPEASNHSRFGYGFQLSGCFDFLEKLKFFYQGVWGKGIASIIQDTIGEGLDLTPSGDGSTLSPPMIWGGFLSLEYDISRRFTTSVTYSQTRAYVPKYTGGSTEWNDMYKYTQYVSANLFFKATSYFEIGLEHIWGRRVNQDGLKCADNRIELAFQLTF